MVAKNRDYDQEQRTARKRGERQGGSNTPDARRKRDRRKVEKKKSIGKNQEVDHKKKGARGGTQVISKSKNRSKGGKIGNKKGKAAGGRKGNKAGKAAGGRASSRKGIKNK